MTIARHSFGRLFGESDNRRDEILRQLTHVIKKGLPIRAHWLLLRFGSVDSWWMSRSLRDSVARTRLVVDFATIATLRELLERRSILQEDLQVFLSNVGSLQYVQYRVAEALHQVKPYSLECALASPDRWWSLTVSEIIRTGARSGRLVELYVDNPWIFRGNVLRMLQECGFVTAAYIQFMMGCVDRLLDPLPPGADGPPELFAPFEREQLPKFLEEA